MNREEIVVTPAPFRGRVRMNSRVLLWPMMSCIALACADERKSITAVQAQPASAVALIDPGELSDPGIDVTDSYLITTSVTRTTTTVESAEPFLDPGTGQEVTSLAFPAVVDTARFEAGYDANGVVRLNEQRMSSDSGGVATRVQIVGNTATFYDEFGVPVHDSAGPMLMDALGPTDDVVVTTNAVFRDAPAGIEEATAPALSVGHGGAASRPRIERRGDRLFQTFTLEDATSGLRGQRIRQYRKSGDHWVVAEERTQTTRSDGTLSFDIVESTVYPTVKWKTNEVKDGRRRARSIASGRGSGAPSFARMRSSTPPALLGGESGPAALSAGSIAPPACLLCADGGDDISTDWSRSPHLNIAFQHGAFSDAGSWSRMDPWMSSRFAIDRKVKPTLSWKDGLESQANTLTGLLSADGGSRYFVVGHSNGGLIARRVAQKSAVAGDGLVAGVVAIAAPHAGLPLANIARSGVQGVLTVYLRNVLASVGGSCGSWQFRWLCGDMNDALLTLVPNVVNYAFDAAVPMSSDVRPNSAFLAMLNAQPEPFFRYSIEVESQGAWKFVRMVGDWKCNPEDRCSGDHLQNTMESVYDVLRYCGSNDLSKLFNSSLAARCRSVRWSLNSLNTMYEKLIAPGDASDGLVPAKSQAYPGVPLEDRERMRNAKESHVGELKSLNVHERLARLTTRFDSQAL